MTVTLNDSWLAVHLADQAVIAKLALLCAKAHCAAEIALFSTNFDIAIFITPFGNERHNRVLTVWHKFRRVGVFHACNVTREFDQRNLHTQADAQIRNFVFTRIACGSDLAFNTTVAEAARDQDSIQIFQNFDAARFHILRINQLDVDGYAIFQATVFQRFNHRFIGIWQFNVLADHTNRDFACRVRFFEDNLFPFGQVCFRAVQAESFTNIIVQPLRFQQAWNFINGIDIFH